MTSDYYVTMTFICYPHKIIPENYFALMSDGRLMYNDRCVDIPRPPHIQLVECSPQSKTSISWELKREGPVWGSLRLYQLTDDGRKTEWCTAQVRVDPVSLLFRTDSSCRRSEFFFSVIFSCRYGGRLRLALITFWLS